MKKTNTINTQGKRKSRKKSRGKSSRHMYSRQKTMMTDKLRKEKAKSMVKIDENKRFRLNRNLSFEESVTVKI